MAVKRTSKASWLPYVVAALFVISAAVVLAIITNLESNQYRLPMVWVYSASQQGNVLSIYYRAGMRSQPYAIKAVYIVEGELQEEDIEPFCYLRRPRFDNGFLTVHDERYKIICRYVNTAYYEPNSEDYVFSEPRVKPGLEGHALRLMIDNKLLAELSSRLAKGDCYTAVVEHNDRFSQTRYVALKVDCLGDK